MRILLVIIVVLSATQSIYPENGIPVLRLDFDTTNSQLAYAFELWQKNNTTAAIKEIQKQVELDSSLITRAAAIIGGNYHLVRLTDNVSADRAGGFSPSGDKLVFARDKSSVKLDDGLFELFEEIKTGLAYLDLTSGEEVKLNTTTENVYRPLFKSDSSILFIAGDSLSILMQYDLITGTTNEYFPFNRQGYCLYQNNIVYYDGAKNAIVMKNTTSTDSRIIYRNDNSLTNYRRPLSLIRNFSARDDVIMFDAGIIQEYKSIYGIATGENVPEIMLSGQLLFGGYSRYFPAAVNYNEFAYLVKIRHDVDIYYHKHGRDYRLTFDGGYKTHLAISPDGAKIAYSYKKTEQGIESFEIFMLDFTRDAVESDLMYRFKYFR